MGSLLGSSLLIPDHHIPSISTTDREQIKGTIPLSNAVYCWLYGLQWIQPSVYPSSGGSSPLRKTAWGPQIGLDSMSKALDAFDRMNIASCSYISWGATKMRHCLEKNLPEERALTSKNVCFFPVKLGKAAWPLQGLESEERNFVFPETHPPGDYLQQNVPIPC